MNTNIYVLFLTLIFVVASYGSILKKEEESTTHDPEEICDRYTPCGWTVYNKLTRDVTTHVKNLCSCPPETLCYRIEDDISMGTYIYRCREKDPRETGDYITG